MGSTEGALRALGVVVLSGDTAEQQRDADGPACPHCGGPERDGACTHGCG